VVEVARDRSHMVRKEDDERKGIEWSNPTGYDALTGDYPSKYSRKTPPALRPSEVPAVRSDGLVHLGHSRGHLFSYEFVPFCEFT
jgi:hypothetical protein